MEETASDTNGSTVRIDGIPLGSIKGKNILKKGEMYRVCPQVHPACAVLMGEIKVVASSK